jgi:hypothetical protein
VTRSLWSRDALARSVLLFGSLVLGGFIAIMLGWRVAARTDIVPWQVPAVVSGALGGLALVVTGAFLLHVQVGRQLAAVERAETEDVLDEAAALADMFRQRRDRR